MSKKTYSQKLKKKAKQRIYKWHKYFAYVTFIPVLFWCLSGIMHPFMAHFFKPEIKNEFVVPKTVDFSKVKFTLQGILHKQKIHEFKNFRYIEMNDVWFYQIKLVDDSLVYFNASNGEKLNNGDVYYAEYLAKFFLEDYQSKVLKTEYLTQFDNQYKYVNRYLPVYKVSFERADKMQVYVETASSKLATFNPISRQAFIWFFDTFHNWSFFDVVANDEVRIILMLLLLGSIIMSALSGIFIYGFFWKVFKKIPPTPENKTRMQHRKLGLWFSVFSIGFAFSGAFHLTKKWNPTPIQDMVYQPVLKANVMKVNTSAIAVDKSKFLNAGVIQYQDTVYYRCEMKAETEPKVENASSDKRWKKKSIPMADIVYVNSQTNAVANGLDFQYAEFLANYFDDSAGGNTTCCEGEINSEKTCSIAKAQIKETKILTEFDSREYGFVNKRLPVVKLAYDTPENTTYFVETATSRIASVTANSDKIEGYTFAIFHKFLWMDWAGKSIRDLVMTLSALILLFIAILGVKLLMKK
jgi:hypothetical protein